MTDYVLDIDRFDGDYPMLLDTECDAKMQTLRAALADYKASGHGWLSENVSSLIDEVDELRETLLAFDGHGRVADDADSMDMWRVDPV